MARQLSRADRRVAKHRRIRQRISGTPTRPRLSIFKSLRAIYVQVIDDTAAHTLAAASTTSLGVTNTIAGAHALGTQFGQRLLASGINSIVFDRSGYIYHGRVAALAQGLRESGIQC